MCFYSFFLAVQCMAYSSEPLISSSVVAIISFAPFPLSSLDSCPVEEVVYPKLHIFVGVFVSYNVLILIKWCIKIAQAGPLWSKKLIPIPF